MTKSATDAIQSSSEGQYNGLKYPQCNVPLVVSIQVNQYDFWVFLSGQGMGLHRPRVI